MTIFTHNINPPIERRDFDWAASTDNYEPGQPVGYGATEADAVNDLMIVLKQRVYKCGNEQCEWSGVIEQTCMLGDVGPLCPVCREIAE